jgi:hypothetical protein
MTVPPLEDYEMIIAVIGEFVAQLLSYLVGGNIEEDEDFEINF